MGLKIIETLSHYLEINLSLITNSVIFVTDKNKITMDKSTFISESRYPELTSAVLEQLNTDWDELSEYCEDYRDASAGIGGFTYYNETVQFAKDNIFSILKVLNEFESECGLLEKPNDDETQYYNWLAWFALESVIQELIDYKECYEEA